MGRRYGKSTMGGAVALSAASRGAKVAWVVPIYKNGRALWRWCRSAVGQLVAAGRVTVHESERTIDFPHNGFLGVYSADNADAMRGEWFHLVIVDEAARIEEWVWTDVIQPTLADVDGDAFLISTPRGKNWFWREWQRGVEDGVQVKNFRAPSSDNPSPAIKRAAMLAKDRVPERTYRQEWLAEFVEEGGATWERSWLEHSRYDAADERMAFSVIARWLSYDTALEEKDTAAYSACIVAELLPDYRMRIRHAWRDRLAFPSLVEHMERDITDWDFDGKLYEVIIENKVSGVSAYQTLMASGSPELRKKLVAFNPKGSKDARFEQAGVWAKNGSLLLPHPSEQTRWLHPLESELFEETEFFDQRDSTAQVILWNEYRLAQGLAARQGRAA